MVKLGWFEYHIHMNYQYQSFGRTYGKTINSQPFHSRRLVSKTLYSTEKHNFWKYGLPKNSLDPTFLLSLLILSKISETIMQKCFYFSANWLSFIVTKSQNFSWFQKLFSEGNHIFNLVFLQHYLSEFFTFDEIESRFWNHLQISQLH